MLNCKQTSQLLSKSLDQPLTLREKLSLRLHMLLCGACSRFARQLRFLREAVEALERRAAEDERLTLNSEARQRIARALRNSE